MVENTDNNVHPIKSLLTGKDNSSFCFAKVAGALALLVGLGLEIYVVVHSGGVFSLTEFGIGVGTLIGAISGAVKLKESSEPS